MTFQELITDARIELGDTYADSSAYPDTDMFRYAVEGVRRAWQMRPSLAYDPSTGKLYGQGALPLQPGSMNESYMAVPVPDTHVEGLVYFIVYRCLSRDVTDRGNAAAAKTAFDQFAAIIGA